MRKNSSPLLVTCSILELLLQWRRFSQCSVRICFPTRRKLLLHVLHSGMIENRSWLALGWQFFQMFDMPLYSHLVFSRLKKSIPYPPRRRQIAGMWRSLPLTEVAICWGTSAQQCPELTFFSHFCPCALISYFCSPPLAFSDQEPRDQNVWLVLKMALKFHPNSNAGAQVSWVESFPTICFQSSALRMSRMVTAVLVFQVK